ncbi:M28 family peptidase [candidate division KSB1 bacterium]|nr:M28 family peptidase [candidate division KSB1 bacterium]
MKTCFVCILIIVAIFYVCPTAAFPRAAFQADSVYQHIYYLSETIGPRPMGSEQEHRALQWVKDKFVSYGADTAYILPFTRSEARGSYYNTRSGTAVGIFKGLSDTCMVISGHIDSTPATGPGANDDASGVATAIELARIWSQRTRHYTMVFCAFGGEEQGLYGSHHFVDHFADLNKVAMMYSLDMTGSDDDIITIMESDSGQAPVWMVRDAFAMDRQLGINRLRYPTHFATLNNLGQGAGSDHLPFLNKNIPAMDFTTGINHSPIHSSQDRIDYIDKDMLHQYGRLIDGLLSKYQSQFLPVGSLDHYALWHPFGVMLFIPVILIKGSIILAILLGGLAFWRSYRSRPIADQSQKVSLSGLKLLLLFIIIAMVSQLGEALIQGVKGLRYPWYLHVEAYVWLMLLWAVAGVWLSLRIARNWRFSDHPHPYAARALIILAILTLLCSLASARFAVYPALALILIAVAVLVRPLWLKLILLFLAPLPLIRLFLSEVTPFIARGLSYSGLVIDTMAKAALFSAAIILIMSLVLLPFIYSTAYAVVAIPWLKRLLKQFRGPLPGMGLAICLIIATWVVGRLPAYNDMWRPIVQVQAEYETPKHEGTIQIKGNEYFQNILAQNDTFQVNLSGREHVEELPLNFCADWLKIAGYQTIRAGERDTVEIDWQLITLRPWYSVTLSLRADTLAIGNVYSNLRFLHKNRSLSFRWRCYPSDTLMVKARFDVHPGARLVRSITANYAMLPLALKVTAPHANVYQQTRVTARDTVLVRIL